MDLKSRLETLKKSNTVTIDWFANTVKPHDVDDYFASCRFVVEELLKLRFLDFSLENYGTNRYNRHFAYADIKLYFSVNGNGSMDYSMGIFTELRGQGCRQYEHFMEGSINNWNELVIRFLENNAHFTRIDIANDIYDGSLLVSRIYEYCKQGLCISYSKKYEYHETGKLENGEIVGETINIGKKGSNSQQWGVYNKLMEQGEKAKELQIESWIRSELRLFGDKAGIFAQNMRLRKPLKELFFSVLASHYRFVLPDSHSKDTKKSRRETVAWWENYIKTKERTKLKIEREEVTLRQSKEFLENQVAKTLTKIYKAYQKSWGTESANAYINYLLKLGEEKMTFKDVSEIEEFSIEEQNELYWALDSK